MNQIKEYYEEQAKWDPKFFDWKISHYRGNLAISQSFEWLEWQNKRVLDIGCGIGYYSLLLASRCLEITGIDLSSEAIEIAECHADRLKIHNANFMTSDLFDFDTDSCFDIIYCITVLMHVQDISRALTKIFTLLSPGGYLLISDANRFFHGRLFSYFRSQPILMHTFTFRMMREELEKAGFKVMRESGRIFSIGGWRKPDWIVMLWLERWGETWLTKYLGEHIVLLAQKPAIGE